MSMINTLSLTPKLFNLLLLFSFSNSKHTSIASRAILSNFFEEQWTQNRPQYLSQPAQLAVLARACCVGLVAEPREGRAYKSKIKSTPGTRIPPATLAIPFGIVACTFSDNLSRNNWNVEDASNIPSIRWYKLNCCIAGIFSSALAVLQSQIFIKMKIHIRICKN